jgi:hypothetical protein
LNEAGEQLTEFHVPNFQLNEVSKALARGGVSLEIIDKIFPRVVEGKESYEITEVKANLLATEVPAIYDADTLSKRRAFRLPAEKKSFLRI